MAKILLRGSRASVWDVVDVEGENKFAVSFEMGRAVPVRRLIDFNFNLQKNSMVSSISNPALELEHLFTACDPLYHVVTLVTSFVLFVRCSESKFSCPRQAGFQLGYEQL